MMRVTCPDEMFARIDEAARYIRDACAEPPRTAVVLGSGLHGVADALADRIDIPYISLPHWPQPQVAGHPGRLVLGSLQGQMVAALAGRAHLYEGYDVHAVVFATRVMWRLGVRQIVLTNAAGGIRADLTPGTLMIIDDHINLLGVNPLIGPNDERLGPRFPDMAEVYSPRLRRRADEAARAAGLTVAHGVYVAMPGPSYETPAEIRVLRTIGADAVGSSTVAEAIAARHLGLEVLGVSCIANPAAGRAPGTVSHEDVLREAQAAQRRLAALLDGVLRAER